MNVIPESSSLLQHTLQEVGIGLWWFDFATHELHWASARKAHFGLAAAAPTTYERFLDLIHPDDRANVRTAIEQAVEQHEPYRTEYRVIWRDGSVHWIEARGETRYDAAGAPVEMAGVTIDVTDRKAAERSLGDTRDRLARAMNYGRVGTWTIVWPSEKVYTDPLIARLFQVPAEDEQGGPLEHYLAAIHPDDRDRVATEIAEAFAQGGGYHQSQYRIPQPDGADCWVDARYQVDCTADGEPLRMAGVLLDVTDRKRANEALRASEEHLNLAMHAADLGSWDSTIVNGELRVDWSPRCKTMFGLPADAEVDLALHESLIHPQDREQVHSAIRRALDPAGDGEYDTDYRVIWPDGTTHWLNSRGRCIFDNDGGNRRPARLIGVVLDITERRRAAADRRRRQENERFLNRTSAILAASLDYDETMRHIARLSVPYLADWTFIDLLEGDRTLRRIEVAHADPAHADLAAMFRAEPPPPERLETPQAQALLEGRPLLVPDVTDMLREAIAQQPLPPRVARMVRLIGDKPASLICVPLVARGKTLGLLTLLAIESGRRYGQNDLAFAQDLAGRAALALDNARLYREAEEAAAALREQADELLQADRRKDEFLATLAHELRNPLAPLSTNLQLLRLAGADSQAARKAQAVMERQVNHLVRLLDDLLDVSRVSRGRIELRKSRVDLSTIITDAIEISRPAIDASGHRLDVDIPPEPVFVDADPARLKQVFVNLLNNGAKFTPRGGHLSLDIAAADGSVRVRVCDSGVGIAPEDLTQIFEMFSQAENQLQSGAGGLGIGLTLTKQLVEMHGGSIEAASAGRGCGSEFIVRLPLATAPADARPTADPAGRAAETPRRRVLVIDDNEDIADSLAMLLEMMNHDVRAVYSGAAGLEAGADFEPHIVFMDIGMPEMNGHDAAREIRQQPWGEKVSLIALTGWGQNEDRRRSREAGFDRHLVKPIDPAMLEQVIREVRDGE
ncbi:MAG TPA: PAS domain-containing protein [Gammaproteobacteria bacterium]|nr:PAS domain-containing protein [Gammaproteobacteria bacterium]